MDIDEKDKEIFFLRDKVYQQGIQISILQKGLKKKDTNKRYSLDEKLFILNYVEAFQIPRNKLFEYVGIAKSTYYRWMHNIETQVKQRTPANKTPAETAALVWEIAKNNTNWGRVRIASQLALLKVFISASTVRNILNRPQPINPKMSPRKQKAEEQAKDCSIPAWYPNHVWSIDNTSVFCWGFWEIHVCLIIDHYSRKIMAVAPLEGRNAGWVCELLDNTIEKYGPPKHIISDQGSVFISQAFNDLLGDNIKHRYGAIGKHGSIAVTERANKTLKYEWLKRVVLIRGYNHLTELCDEFQVWYNQWRPHMTLDGLRPDDVFYGNKPEMPGSDAKKVPPNIEQRFFSQTRTMGYRLKQSA